MDEIKTIEIRLNNAYGALQGAMTTLVRAMDTIETAWNFLRAIEPKQEEINLELKPEEEKADG
jgi:hypothetical protein